MKFVRLSALASLLGQLGCLDHQSVETIRRPGGGEIHLVSYSGGGAAGVSVVAIEGVSRAGTATLIAKFDSAARLGAEWNGADTLLVHVRIGKAHMEYLRSGGWSLFDRRLDHWDGARIRYQICETQPNREPHCEWSPIGDTPQVLK